MNSGKIRIIFLEVDGDESVLRDTISYAMESAGFGTAAAVVPPVTVNNTDPSPVAGEPPAPRRHRRLVQKSSLPAPADLASQAPARGNDRRVWCDEVPDKTFSIAEASKMSGVLERTIRINLAPSMQKRSQGHCGEFHFHPLDPSNPPKWSRDARPRTRPDSAPLNPNIVGRSNPHQPQE